MIPTTVDRVPRHTSEAINHRIRRQTEQNIAHHAHAGVAELEERFRQLDEEWDIERTLEANAATVSLIGVCLGAFVDRRFFILPGLVAGFLLQHAVQGWCPPLPMFRRLGIRTQPEIEQERYALKAIRGDFARVSDGTGHVRPSSMADAIAAVRQ